MKWKYLGASCVMAGSIVHLLGAPLPAIGFGIALAILWKVRQERRQTLTL